MGYRSLCKYFYNIVSNYLHQTFILRLWRVAMWSSQPLSKKNASSTPLFLLGGVVYCVLHASNIRLQEKWVRRPVPWTNGTAVLTSICFTLQIDCPFFFFSYKNGYNNIFILYKHAGKIISTEEGKCSCTAVIRIGFVYRSTTVKHPWVISASKQNLTFLMVSFCLVGWLKGYDNLKGSCNFSTEWLCAVWQLFLQKCEGNWSFRARWLEKFP